MICYLIQCHQLSDQVNWLVDQLQDQDNSFVISVDGTDEFHQEICANFRGREDVHVLRSKPVAWCGSSQVVALLDGIRAALQEFDKWEVLVNLSGQCFPLQSQQNIKQFLVEAISQDQKLFMSIFKPRVCPPITFQSSSRLSSSVDISIFDAKGTHCRIHPELALYFKSWADSPVMKAYLRTSMWMAEDPIEKTLYIRPLYEYEARYREGMFERWPHHCGRAWYMMHRSFLEWMVGSPRTDEMFSLFSTVFEPDESFIQTLVMSEPKWAARVVSKNYRLNDGKPSVISDDANPMVERGGVFFGRKLLFDKSPATINMIEGLRGN